MDLFALLSVPKERGNMGNKNPNKILQTRRHRSSSNAHFQSGKRSCARRATSNSAEEPISACKAGLIVGLLSILGFLGVYSLLSIVKKAQAGDQLDQSFGPKW